jgi:hypothetical protein
MLQVSRICAAQAGGPFWPVSLVRRYSGTTANLTAANKDIGKVTLPLPCFHPVFHPLTPLIEVSAK